MLSPNFLHHYYRHKPGFLCKVNASSAGVLTVILLIVSTAWSYSILRFNILLEDECFASFVCAIPTGQRYLAMKCPT